MGGRKILITVSDEQYKALENLAEERGLRVSSLVKSLAIKNSKKPYDANTKEITVTLANYSELEGYAMAKRFGTVESFAGYAMEAWMSRNPLTAAQKALVGKSIGISETDAL